MDVDPRNMQQVVQAILAGESTDSMVAMATAHHAERRALMAEYKATHPHKCKVGRCCWHDPVPFRKIRDEHIETAIAAMKEGR